MPTKVQMRAADTPSTRHTKGHGTDCPLTSAITPRIAMSTASGTNSTPKRVIVTPVIHALRRMGCASSSSSVPSSRARPTT